MATHELPPGLLYDSGFLRPSDREQILTWIASLKPIWEQRYSTRRPPPVGRSQRQLLRPVYWLGNWQFACLDYYAPPHGVENRCVRAEPFPPVLQKLVDEMERRARREFRGKDMPPKWKLNTCLVNFYGAHQVNGRVIDAARVGEHKDFEPGPVASLSLGERALFQFVESAGFGHRSKVAFQQWLDNGSLQIFGGTRWKQHYFHRVQRVEEKGCIESLPPHVEDFFTRRINFTFRYVPEQHVVPFAKLPGDKAKDVEEYMKQLAVGSEFFQREVEKRKLRQHQPPAFRQPKSEMLKTKNQS